MHSWGHFTNAVPRKDGITEQTFEDTKQPFHFPEAAGSCAWLPPSNATQQIWRPTINQDCFVHGALLLQDLCEFHEGFLRVVPAPRLAIVQQVVILVVH